MHESATRASNVQKDLKKVISSHGMRKTRRVPATIVHRHIPKQWDPFDFKYYTFSKGKLFITLLPWEREERRKSCVGSRDQWALSAKHTCSNVAPYCRLHKKKKLIRYFHSQHSCLNLEPNNIIFTCERNRNNVTHKGKEWPRLSLFAEFSLVVWGSVLSSSTLGKVCVLRSGLWKGQRRIQALDDPSLLHPIAVLTIHLSSSWSCPVQQAASILTSSGFQCYPCPSLP